ncbi:complexin-3-like [Spea bombifrons]|uniref:complexin-3-like n=1 Tax=Spea bombifrons TaxID=233779 RepID=UPI00234BB0C6|nr:complexin-3-like [Spea bombifrons]
MAALAKSMFGGPVKSTSCCTSSGFSQENGPPRGEMLGGNITRRWSSEDQYHQNVHVRTKRRDSFYAQQRVERAAMREHFRTKYNLTKNVPDVQQVKTAGGNLRVSKEVRAMVRPREPAPESFSIHRFWDYHTQGHIKKGPRDSTGTSCLIM